MKLLDHREEYGFFRALDKFNKSVGFYVSQKCWKNVFHFFLNKNLKKKFIFEFCMFEYFRYLKYTELCNLCVFHIPKIIFRFLYPSPEGTS